MTSINLGFDPDLIINISIWLFGTVVAFCAVLLMKIIDDEPYPYKPLQRVAVGALAIAVFAYAWDPDTSIGSHRLNGLFAIFAAGACVIVMTARAYVIRRIRNGGGGWHGRNWHVESH